MHAQYYDWFLFSEVMSIGLLLGYMRYRSNSTWLTIIMHGINNFAATLQSIWLAGHPDRHCEERSDEAIQSFCVASGLLRFARNDGYSVERPSTASRSSAPCKMKIAACSSITLARLARLMSMPISSRSTATVESRSSHSAMAQVGEFGKIAGESAGGLRARAFAAVHVDGQAEHEAGGIALTRDDQQPRGVCGKVLARNGLHAGRQPAIGIGHRDADGLGAEIEPDQRAAFGPMRGRFDQR